MFLQCAAQGEQTILFLEKLNCLCVRCLKTFSVMVKLIKVILTSSSHFLARASEYPPVKNFNRRKAIVCIVNFSCSGLLRGSYFNITFEEKRIMSFEWSSLLKSVNGKLEKRGDGVGLLREDTEHQLQRFPVWLSTGFCVQAQPR